MLHERTMPLPRMLEVSFLGMATLTACGPPVPASTRSSPTTSAELATLALERACQEGAPTPACIPILTHECEQGVGGSCALATSVRAQIAFGSCVHGLVAKDDAGAGSRRLEWSAACDEASTLLEQSCALDRAKDCRDAKKLGTLQRTASQIRAASTCLEESVVECTAACDGGDLDACVEVGTMYASGTRVARDVTKGGGILRDACVKGSMRACFAHGTSSLATDPAAAASSLKVACEGAAAPWNQTSCALLLHAFDSGAAVPKAERIAALREMCARETSGKLPKLGACGRLRDLGIQ